MAQLVFGGGEEQGRVLRPEDARRMRVKAQRDSCAAQPLRFAQRPRQDGAVSKMKTVEHADGQNHRGCNLPKFRY
jgi:hypothetical protein